MGQPIYFNGMIIGSGDIASVLQDREGAVFFASGVSNSQCTYGNEFLREASLLVKTIKENKDKCLFYFSSLQLSVEGQKITPYLDHKILMELLIKQHASNYNIIRIGNIPWGTNPNTFMNYFRNCLDKGLEYKVFDEYRYLISKEELLLLTNNLPLIGQNTISVTGRIVKVQTIVDELMQEHDKRRGN